MNNTNERDEITGDRIVDLMPPVSPLPITPAELAEWRAVVEKATPGPWFDIEHVRFKGADHRISTQKDGDWDSFANIATVARNDAPFVALARTALPRLIDEVEAGRRDSEQLRAWLRQARERSTEIANERDEARTQLREAQGEVARLKGNL